MKSLTFEEIKAINFVDLNNKDYRVLVKYDINYEVNKEYKILYIEAFAHDRITICITDGFLEGFTSYTMILMVTMTLYYIMTKTVKIKQL